MYICYECNSEVEIKKVTSSMFCPKCAGRVLLKLTPPVTNRIKCI